MSALLSSLKDIPFPELPHASERRANERSDSLSALMQVLQDQAEHDGFRLITINAELKRVILACNRQGKPPSTTALTPTSSPSTTVLPSVDEVDDDGASSTSSDERKRSNRYGTSIRCGCRMRVNVNFHSKLNAWRITSYEDQHNHLYGNPNSQECEEESKYEVTTAMVIDAIRKCAARYRPVSAGGNERDAIAALTALGSPSTTSIQSTVTETGLKSASVSPVVKLPSISVNAGTMGQRPNKIIVIRRSSISPKSPMSVIPPTLPNQTSLGSAESRGLQSSVPSVFSENSSASSSRHLAKTAMEVDRYAMMHTSFKKLIAVACRKREWTQEVLNGLGRFMEALQNQEDHPLFAPSSNTAMASPNLPMAPPPTPIESQSPIMLAKIRFPDIPSQMNAELERKIGDLVSKRHLEEDEMNVPTLQETKRQCLVTDRENTL